MDVKTDSHQKMHRGIRNSNIELFRIISMLVIVAHHYVANSGVINEIVGITEPQLKDYFLADLGMGRKDRHQLFCADHRLFYVQVTDHS